jgi:hypothetical protein
MKLRQNKNIRFLKEHVPAISTYHPFLYFFHTSGRTLISGFLFGLQFCISGSTHAFAEYVNQHKPKGQEHR